LKAAEAAATNTLSALSAGRRNRLRTRKFHVLIQFHVYDNHRRRNLQLIVNNGRYLVLPWVRIKGLASKIMALSARQIPHEE
jgi:Domain of unknown function (DUF4338)